MQPLSSRTLVFLCLQSIPSQRLGTSPHTSQSSPRVRLGHEFCGALTQDEGWGQECLGIWVFQLEGTGPLTIGNRQEEESKNRLQAKPFVKMHTRACAHMRTDTWKLATLKCRQMRKIIDTHMFISQTQPSRTAPNPCHSYIET